VDASADSQPAPEVTEDAQASAEVAAPDPLVPDPACDPLVPSVCAMPWPSNRYLVADKATATGYRVHFPQGALPANQSGKHVDGKDWSLLDGYNVTTPLLMHFPGGVDMSQLPQEATPTDALAANSPIVWLAVKGNKVERIPCFAELDQNEHDTPDLRTFIVRPAVLLEEGTRYVVALRGLKHPGGKPIAPSPAFAALRDGMTAGSLLAARQSRFDEIFQILEQQGVAKSGLTLAWDFVTASSQTTHGDMLTIRTQGFAAVGAKGPELTIQSVVETTVEQNAHIALTVKGTFKVPHFVHEVPIGKKTGWRIHRTPDGKPTQNGWRDAEFLLRVPHSALTGKPHGLIQYGHGLLGSLGQVEGGFNGKIANQHGFLLFACNMTGMANEDVPTIFAMIEDFTHFPALPERIHQGLLENLLLARSMRERLQDLPELQKYKLAINKDELFWSGISQGGIYGATYLALSSDVTRAHLGVPGNNYSLLMERSSDFIPYLLVILGSYPDSRDRILLLSLIQMRWDSVDPASYLRHLSKEPFPGLPPHHALFASAKGDWQVALLSNEILARSGFGVALMSHYGRPVAGVPESPYPHIGSGIVNYDFGNPWPAPGNSPPYDALGDPHGKPRQQDWHNEQMVHFFRTGEIKDVCGGDGCTPQ